MAVVPNFSGSRLIIHGTTPPSGIISNFADSENHDLDLVIVSSLCLALVVISVAVRMYSKFFVTRKPGLDDFVCFIATIGTAGYVTTALLAARAGIWSREQNNIVFDTNPEKFLRLFYVIDLTYPPTVLCVKLSLFLLFLQACQTKGALRYCVYIGIVFTTLSYLATMVGELAMCSPSPGELLFAAVSTYSCAQTRVVWLVQAAVNVFIDFYILFLPIPIVMRLKLSPVKTVGVTLACIMGLSACIASIMGVYYRMIMNDNDDLAWNIVPILLLAILEMSLGIICSCLPAISRLHHHHPSIFSSIATLLRTKSTTASARLTSLLPVRRVSQTSAATRHNYSSTSNFPSLSSSVPSLPPQQNVDFVVEFGQLNSMSTVIQTGAARGDVDEDCIYLEQDIRQTFCEVIPPPPPAPKPPKGAHPQDLRILPY